jgi:hypothetical protein
LLNPAVRRIAQTFLTALALALSLGPLGCVSKSEANRRAHEAYLRGQRDAAAAARQPSQTSQPTVTVRGNVRRPNVPWTEELTVSRALVEAQWIGRLNPTQILVRRGSQIFSISVRQLLNGLQDLYLEPGDVVEVR